MASIPSFPDNTAAINWFDSAGKIHIRIYSSDGSNVTERCMDQGGNWYSSNFKQPGAHVSATCWLTGGNVNIRVYCTGEDKTQEWCNGPETNGWQAGTYTTS